MKKLLTILTVLVLAWSTWAWADYTISNGGIIPDLNRTVFGQSFTTVTAGAISSIMLRGSIGSSVALTLNIYAGESTAAPLYSQSVTRSGSGWTNHTFTLTTPLAVTAATQYTFTLVGSANFSASRTIYNSYADGSAYYGGGFQSSADMNFAVNVAALPNYTVSGFVTHASLPVSDVTLTFSHDGGTTTTNILGYYSYTVVSGTTTTITPSKTGYASWSPATRTLTNITSNQSNQDFAGSLNTYTITGTVTDGVNPIAGATLFFSHNLGTTTTDADGNYSYSVYHGTMTTITPSHPAYENWSPLTRLLMNVTSNQTDQNFTGTLKTFVITGIVHSGLTPLAGATVTFSHNGATATTGPLGVYSYSVPYGTTTTVTPSLAGYGNWTPPSRTFSNVTENHMLQNFSGSIVPVTISGTVTDGSNPLAGVTLTLSHNGATTTTDAIGAYAFSVDYGTTTTMTPSHPGYSIWEPAEITLENIAADQPDQNFNTQPSRLMVAIQFKDEAGLPVGDVMCRLKVPGLQEWKVLSKPEMQLLWGKFPFNALFRNWDMALGGQYVFHFTAPSGWAFVSPDSMVLDVPAAANFYSTEGHLFILTKTAPAPVEPGGTVPPPPVDEHPLVFVSGSPAWDSESWPNVVDEDLEGWDGTGTVKADETGYAWSIFRFRGSQTGKFNYFTIQTDNGTDDDAYADRQPFKVEVLASSDGTQPGDFHSLGVFRLKSPQQTFYKIGQEVTAKYVMLRLFTVPGAKNDWQQVVEFGLSWNKGGSAMPASDELTIAVLPNDFVLEPNFPNPFNPETTLRYQLPEDAHVRLSVCNLFGQEVARLVDGMETAGAHSLRWNAAHLSSGVYMVRLTAGQHMAMQRISLLK